MSLFKNFPKGIKYIVWNEAAERYSYYGMRSILVIFLTSYLMMERSEAITDYHLFAGLCYLFPVIGAYVSDRFLGKYKTILWLSIVYCIGHLFLAIFEHSYSGFYAGLMLIAVGSGGIKPCVSAHVGDQFKSSEKDKLRKVFDLFYFMINFGSFFSTMITPWTLKAYGPGVAFGVPGILMAIATFIFWLGRNTFVHVPPSGSDPDSFGTVILSASLKHLKVNLFDVKKFAIDHPVWMFIVTFTLNPVLFIAAFIKKIIMSLLSFNFSKPFTSVLDKEHSEEKVLAVNAVFSVIKIFAGISVFWALFDQHGSSWVLQAKEMDLDVSIFGWDFTLLPSQIPSLNPIMVMALIPFFSFVVYPFIEKRLNYEMTPLRRMGWGMFVAAASFIFVAVYQSFLDSGDKISVLWQVIPFLVITMAEVMVSITGLEFAYTQAPRSMKSTIMSMFLLTVFFGNMITAFVSKINVFEGAAFFLFFAALMASFAIFFAFMAKNYKMQDFMEE